MMTVSCIFRVVSNGHDFQCDCIITTAVTLSFGEVNYSVSESSGFVDVTVMKQGESQVDVTVTLSTSNVSANGEDTKVRLSLAQPDSHTYLQV